MPVFIDQTSRPITLDHLPQRIVSLVPSQTELLADLGLEQEVAGITKFCVHPDAWFRHKTRVGGTKQLKMDLIRQLAPDLIIANKEENAREQVEELQQHYRVWISDIQSLDDAYGMIRQVGLITGKEVQAQKITDQIKENFGRLSAPDFRLPAIYLIWQHPFMSIGHDTFIHAMMEKAGFDNLFKNKTRYPELTLEYLEELQPEVVLLSSEPFPFQQKHADELAAHLPHTKIVLVDGEMFSWYGSRLIQAPSYFDTLMREITDTRQ